MLRINYKKILIYFFLVVIIFSLDRISKLYVLSLLETNNMIDIYITSFLNLYLVWNKGIAFGLFSFDENSLYKFTTLLITLIILIIFVMMIKTENYKVYFLISILGGSLGNLFDRIYYSAVPDFIDFHIKGFHWFVFNVADIFITLGILCLIIAEMFPDKFKK
tara:strand:- start:88 stop:576 length:489 start_codon:yes stop_codon:yes gene_type:complete